MADKDSIPELALKYVILVARCESMRCQIPGNEIDDSVRMAIAAFSRCTPEEKGEVLAKVADRLYDTTAALLATVMLEKAGDIIRGPSGSTYVIPDLSPTVTEAPEQVCSDTAKQDGSQESTPCRSNA